MGAQQSGQPAALVPGTDMPVLRHLARELVTRQSTSGEDGPWTELDAAAFRDLYRKVARP